MKPQDRFTPAELARIRRHVAYMKTIVSLTPEMAEFLRRQIIEEDRAIKGADYGSTF